MMLLALLLQAAALPPGAPPPVPIGSISVEPVGMMIAAFDGDADGRVTRAEFDAGVAGTFAGEGQGSMGLLDLAAWAQRWLGSQGAVPGQYDFDRDGDDRISRAEYGAEFDKLFARFDANKDRVLDRSELIRIAQPPPQRGEKRERREPPQPR